MSNENKETKHTKDDVKKVEETKDVKTSSSNHSKVSNFGNNVENKLTQNTEINEQDSQADQMADQMSNQMKDTYRTTKNVYQQGKKPLNKLNKQVLNNQSTVSKTVSKAGSTVKSGASKAVAGAGKALSGATKVAGKALGGLAKAAAPVLLKLSAIILLILLAIALISHFTGLVIDNEFSRTNEATYDHSDVGNVNTLITNQLGAKGNVVYNPVTKRYELANGKLPTQANRLHFTYYAVMARQAQWFVEYENDKNGDFQLVKRDKADIPYTLDGYLFSAANMGKILDPIEVGVELGINNAFDEYTTNYINELAVNVNLLYLLDSSLHGSMLGTGKNQTFFAEQFTKPVYHYKPNDSEIGQNDVDAYDFKPLVEYKDINSLSNEMIAELKQYQRIAKGDKYNGVAETEFQRKYLNWSEMLDVQNANRGGGEIKREQQQVSGEHKLLAMALAHGKAMVDKGFTYSQASRMGPSSYDCSSFIHFALKKAGMDGLPEGWALTTVTILQQTDTYVGSTGQKALFREIKDKKDWKKGTIVVSGGLGGLGDAGHVVFLMEDWHGPDTKVMESTTSQGVNGGAYSLTAATQTWGDAVGVVPIQTEPGANAESIQGESGVGGGSVSSTDFDEEIKGVGVGTYRTTNLIAQSRVFNEEYNPQTVETYRRQVLNYPAWRVDDFYIEEAPTGGTTTSGQQNNTRLTVPAGGYQEMLKNFRIDAVDPESLRDPNNLRKIFEYYSGTQGRQSKLLGHEQTIIDMSDKYGVNLVAYLGQIALETTFATVDCGGAVNNFGCFMYADWMGETFPGQVGKKYTDRYWADPATAEIGIEIQFKLLRSFYIDANYIYWPDYIERYSPAFENDHEKFAKMYHVIKQNYATDWNPNETATKQPGGNGGRSSGKGTKVIRHNKNKQGTTSINGISNLNQVLDITKYSAQTGNTVFNANQGWLDSSTDISQSHDEWLTSNNIANSYALEGYMSDRSDLMIWSLDRDINPAFAVALVNVLSEGGSRDFLGNKYNFLNDTNVIKYIGGEEKGITDFTNLSTGMRNRVKEELANNQFGNSGTWGMVIATKAGLNNNVLQEGNNLPKNFDMTGFINFATAYVMNYYNSDGKTFKKEDYESAINGNYQQYINQIGVDNFNQILKSYLSGSTYLQGGQLTSTMRDMTILIHELKNNFGVIDDKAVTKSVGTMNLTIELKDSDHVSYTVGYMVAGSSSTLVQSIMSVVDKFHQDYKPIEDDETTTIETVETQGGYQYDPTYGSNFYSYESSLLDIYDGLDHLMSKLKQFDNKNTEGTDFTYDMAQKAFNLTESEYRKVFEVYSQVGGKGTSMVIDLPKGTGKEIKVFTYNGAGADDAEGLGRLQMDGKTSELKIGGKLKYKQQKKDVYFGENVVIPAGMNEETFIQQNSALVRNSDGTIQTRKGVWDHGFGNIYKIARLNLEALPIKLQPDGNYYSARQGLSLFQQIGCFFGNGNECKQSVKDDKYIVLGITTPFGSIDLKEDIAKDMKEKRAIIEQLKQSYYERYEREREDGTIEVIENKAGGVSAGEISNKFGTTQTQSLNVLNGNYNKDEALKHKNNGTQYDQPLYHTVMASDMGGTVFITDEPVVDPKGQIQDVTGADYFMSYIQNYITYVPSITESDLNVVQRYRVMTDVTRSEQTSINEVLEIFDVLYAEINSESSSQKTQSQTETHSEGGENLGYGCSVSGGSQNFPLALELGPKINYFFGNDPQYGSYHSAIDASYSTPGSEGGIFATNDGVVEQVITGCSIGDGSCGGGYGNFVKLKHNDGSGSGYAHLKEGSVTVKQGDTVKAGQKLGMMGTTGRSNGVHLHFEWFVNGQKVNPLKYLYYDQSLLGRAIPAASLPDSNCGQGTSGVGRGTSVGGAANSISENDLWGSGQGFNNALNNVMNDIGNSIANIFGSERSTDPTMFSSYPTVNSSTWYNRLASKYFGTANNVVLFSKENGSEHIYGNGELIINGADAYKWTRVKVDLGEKNTLDILRQYVLILEGRPYRPVYFDEVFDWFTEYDMSRIVEEHHKRKLKRIFDKPSQERNTAIPTQSGLENRQSILSNTAFANMTITRAYGNYINDNGNQAFSHQVYIQADQGTEVLAMDLGEVVYSNATEQIVMIRLQSQEIAVYEGVTPMVSVGSKVNRGQALGVVSTNYGNNIVISMLGQYTNVSFGLKNPDGTNTLNPELSGGENGKGYVNPSSYLGIDRSTMKQLEEMVNGYKYNEETKQYTYNQGKPTRLNEVMNLGSSGIGQVIQTIINQYLHTPYVWGGPGVPGKGWDCSSMIQWAYGQVGISLNRTAAAQSLHGVEVSQNNLQVGDILYWGGKGSAYHVAIYVGDGKILHAVDEARDTKVTDINFMGGFEGAVRIIK